MLPPNSKAKAHALLRDLARGEDIGAVYYQDATATVTAPWGNLTGTADLARLWSDLRTAIPDMERRDLIFVGGENRDDPRLAGPRAPHLIAALGHLQGTFTQDLKGITATHSVIHLRYSEAHWLDGDRIRQSWLHFDLIDLMDQAGISVLPPSFGAKGMWPGPATNDGVRLKDTDWHGPDALDTVFAMHNALLSFDGKSLASMPHAEHWTPDFMYYAAGGIGITRGLDGFRAHHQIPFLKAFPDRISEGHYIRISDGPYAVTGGVVAGTHQGPYLGMTPTGRRIRMPVMDFYRLEGDLIAENWLPMDVTSLAAQMGNDLFARLAHYRGNPKRDL